MVSSRRRQNDTAGGRRGLAHAPAPIDRHVTSWFRPHTVGNGLKPAGSTRRVFLLLLSGVVTR
jgi:hypothetical protein